MKKEHCEAGDSLLLFRVDRWSIARTNPTSEWKYVMDPRSLTRGKKWSGLGERPLDYDYRRLMKERDNLNLLLRERGHEELRKEEAIGARLLTG